MSWSKAAVLMQATSAGGKPIFAAILAEYEATEEEAKTGVDALLTQMREANLLEE